MKLRFWPSLAIFFKVNRIGRKIQESFLPKDPYRVMFLERWGAKSFGMFLALIASIFQLVSPWPQKIFIDSLTINTSPLNPKYLFFLLCLSLISLVLSYTFSFWARFVFAAEGAIFERHLSQKIFLHGLNSHSSANSVQTVGEKVSLFAQDVRAAASLLEELFPMGVQSLLPLVISPIVLKLMLNLPIFEVSLVLLATIIVSFILGGRQSRIFNLYKKEMDSRISIVNEWVQNIRTLRLTGEVRSFEKKIFTKIDEECRLRKSLVSNGGLMNTLPLVAPVFINITGIFALIRYKHGLLTPGEIFSLIWVLGVFMTRPLRFIPWFISMSLDGFISLRRLSNYFAHFSQQLPFLEKPSIIPQTISKGISVSIENLDLNLNGQSILKKIDLKINAGELVVIVGPVGSGKTLLLQSFLGEVPCTYHQYFLGDEQALAMDLEKQRSYFSYVPQDSLMINTSLRNNVGLNYTSSDPQQDFTIMQSLELAQFLPDMQKIEMNLDSPIGERGPNISGGQKQRISLARADYFDRPILLLDDCLSAVDVKTEKLIIDDLILGRWKEKTRILVTHRQEVLQYADQVIFMQKGRIERVVLRKRTEESDEVYPRGETFSG